MKKNMGSADRIIRLSVFALIFILILGNVLTGIAAVVLGALAVIFLLTSLVGFCPLYFPFKIKTTKKV